jgi:Mg-chelatase subunit ChlD
MRARRVALFVLAFLCAVVATAASGAGVAADTPQPDSLCAPGQAGVIYGTSRNDALVGTQGDDVICGLAGNDAIDGRGGNDVVDAGAGNDAVSAGGGDDEIFGEDGNDSLDGGTGNDGLWGGTGVDTLSGAVGNDGLSGGDGNDVLSSASGDDSLEGGNGDDTLSSASGDDVLDGGDGRDVLSAASGDDICKNGEVVAGCERGAEALDPLATPVPIDAAPIAAPDTITVPNTFPGVSVTIDTDGGIYPWEVEITPARLHMSGRMEQALAGPAYDITVPESAPPIRGGSLTLPYDEGRLGGFAEGDLRIFTFDEDTQLWVPAPGPQSVDPASNTVTASIAHLSVYAVLKLRTADQWREIFGQTPLLCAGGTSGAALDVVFVVDVSGSMSGNDPNGLRVDGAKAFVDKMRPQDRAAVVAFNSFARREIDLTKLDNEAAITSVKAALERTREPGGGTSISAAVSEATAILANNGSTNLRVAILLTDGQSGYDPNLTVQAAQNLIGIHTVGLGAGVSESLLQGIASGTGATYRKLDDPAQLVALYEQLAGDIIGDDTDTDGDGLTDCVERNGLFAPLRITFPFITGSLDFASFITTDPEKADTDGDGLTDGEEVEGHDLRANPALASTYDFLIAQGLKTYYTLKSNPNDVDSDDDGVNDLLERQNGTNPLVPDKNELGIEGLDLPRFTLFQPSRYAKKPAVPSRLQLTGNLVEAIFYNDNPVTYDDGRNCVENCDAVRKLAQARPNDNGFGICIFGLGNCVDDASQQRDIVEEARVAQGIFDRNGFLDENFLREQVALQCAIWFANSKNCGDSAAKIDFRDNPSPDDYTDLLAAGTIAIPAPGLANPETARRIAEILAKTAAVVAAGIGAAALEETIRKCIEGPALRVVQQLLPFVHPCEVIPAYAPGGDFPTSTEHRVAAIAGNPLRVLQRYASPAERAARPFGRAWYLGQPGCTVADRAAAEARYGVPVSCDEFPNWSMEDAGPGKASLRYIPAADNGGEGARLGTFFLACSSVTRAVRAERVPFLVIPVPVAPATVFHCGRT